MIWNRAIRGALMAACVLVFATAAQAGPTMDQVRARHAGLRHQNRRCRLRAGRYTTAIIEAEEKDITAANAEQMRRTSTNPYTHRLLGVTPELGQAVKLDPAWAYNVIRAIGNHGELYERTMGEATPVALPRGPNNLWTNGGLMYALPMR